MRFSDWRRNQIREAYQMALDDLSGVGLDRRVFTTVPPGYCLHVQAALKPSEIDLLPPGWMDIRAIDERGPVQSVSIR